MSKGSGRRPSDVTHDEYASNYDRIFSAPKEDVATRWKGDPFLPGDTVVCAHPEWGYDYDQEQLRKAGIRHGDTFVLEGVQVGGWRTDIRLVGVSGEFNSVHFVRQ